MSDVLALMLVAASSTLPIACLALLVWSISIWTKPVDQPPPGGGGSARKRPSPRPPGPHGGPARRLDRHATVQRRRRRSRL